MDRTVVACVLAGGTGTRLYPASRSFRPKQLLALGSDRSLLERTLERARFADERYVLTRESFAEDVRARAPDAGVLVEPAAKDTGPALVYAAWRLREAGGGSEDAAPVLVTLPSDHHVGDDTAFARALERAAGIAAETDGLVTLGVEPTRPATGYGYVVPESDLDRGGEGDAATGADDAADAYAPVERFTEKPDRDTAAALLERGAYWNAGIFAWTPDALLCEARNSPLAPLVEALEDGDSERGFAAVDPISVDYAVLERTDAAYVTPLALEWDDLGTWDAVGRICSSGSAPGENVTVNVGGAGDVGVAGDVAGAGDAADTGDVFGAGGERASGDDAAELLSIDAENNVVAAPDAHVSLVGVDDLVVAAIDDRVLVVPRDEAQRVREVVTRLREADRHPF